jgi:subtilisin family serine protease
VVALALIGNPTYAAAPSTGDAKVSAAVRAAAEGSSKITFWVTFTGKANLSTAATMKNKADRGAEVRRLKMETAASTQATVRGLLDSAGADYKPYWISNRIKVTGESKLLDTLAARPEVASIEEDKTIKVPDPIVETTTGPNAVEWGIDRINAPRVWNELGTRGDGIVVANIDTGVQFDHPAVVGKYRGNLGGSFDHNYNWFDPSHVCPSAAPCDNNDHGTHTMGTMVGDDGGANQIGVAPNAKWIAAKGCESSSCSESALLASGEWIIAPTDLTGANPRPDLAPDVVNNSWGGAGFDPFYQDIVDSWNAAGIFPAFSNGNSGPACNTSGSPGLYVNSYASGAFDINNAIASFSSRGPGLNGDIKPNIAAPGVNVRSSIPGGSYANFSGTSMASPHTAGAVALIWSASPALKGDIAGTRALLDATAIDVDATGCGGTAADNNIFGEGRLDAFAAVSNAPRGPLGGLSGVITSGGSPLAGATVTAAGPINRTFVTGADGAYSFPVLSTGTYTVSASKFGFVTGTGTATVTEGATTTLDLDLVAAASSTVSGTVTSAGTAVAGATVKLIGSPLQTVTDAAGFYSITAPNGSYTLSVSSPLKCFDPSSQPLTLNGNVTVNVALPVRSDTFGYACSTATGGYPTVSDLLPLTGDDVQLAKTLPFTIPFYGVNYNAITITTNGSAAFGTASATQSNVPIPNTGAPNGAIYPLWDDLFVDGLAGIYTGVIGTAPHRKFVIDWRNVRSFFDSTQRLSFAAELGEDGGITYRYKDVTGSSYATGTSATIGLENETGTDAFQYSFEQGVVSSGLAIAFRTTKHGVVRGVVTDANDGLPVAGAAVAFDQGGGAVSGADGSYLKQIPSGARTITVTKAAYGTSTSAFTLPAADVATVNVALATAKVTATPASLTLVVPVGESRIRTVTVANVGGLATPLALSEEGGDVPWLGASLAASSLNPGGTTKLTIAVDATGLTKGTVYNGALKITSQSGRNPDLLVPVKLVVPGFQQALDAGSNNSHVDSLGDTWGKDFKFVAGEGCGYMGSTNVVSTSHAIAGTDDPGRYADARQNMFEYRCDGLANGTYTVELNFAELTNNKPNKRLFDVIIEGNLVLPSLDISLEAGNFAALNKTFTVTVTDGVLDIRFITHTGFGKPIVSALRVTHRPDL